MNKVWALCFLTGAYALFWLAGSSLDAYLEISDSAGNLARLILVGYFRFLLPTVVIVGVFFFDRKMYRWR